MAITKQNTPTSLNINIQDSQPVDLFRLSQLPRLFWHFSAYGIIFGILILSLIFLSILCDPRVMEISEWELNSIN